MRTALLNATVEAAPVVGSDELWRQRVHDELLTQSETVARVRDGPGLECIEGRAVTASFLKRFTAEHATPTLKYTATNQAIPWLEGKIRAVEQELSLGVASKAGTETRDLGRALFCRYKKGELSEEEYNERRDAHAIASQQRSNREMLESSLETLNADLEKRKQAPFLTARDVHKLVIKAACDASMCRYGELPDSRVSHLWTFDAAAPRVGDGHDPETKVPDFGMADFFLSYNWDTPWDELLDALITHSERQQETGAPPPYYWIDIFAVNQHDAWSCDNADPKLGKVCPGCAAVGDDLHDWSSADPENPKGFERVIAYTKKTVMLMEPWDKPRPPTRVWCLFEGNTTIAKGGQLEVVLGRKQQRQLQKALEDRFVELEDNLSQIDARRAEATVMADRAAIFDAVEGMTSGFEGLNDTMRAALRRWLAEVAVDLVERLRPDRSRLTPAELRAEATEHGPCTVQCIKLADRCPRLADVAMAITLCTGGITVSVLSLVVKAGLDGADDSVIIRLFLIVMGLFLGALICFGVGTTTDSIQTRHQLRRKPLYGLGLLTRNEQEILAIILWAAFFISLPIAAAFGVVGFLFTVSATCTAAGVIALPVEQDLRHVIQRSELAIKAGWVLLRLGELEEAAQVFRATHQELQRGAGSRTQISWISAAGLVRALHLSSEAYIDAGDTSAAETAIAEADALRANLESVVSSVDQGCFRCRRVLCKHQTAKDVAGWHFERAKLAVAARAPISEILNMLEEAAAGGCSYEPGKHLPEWDQFMQQMGHGGGASDAERHRWDAYREVLASNKANEPSSSECCQLAKAIAKICFALVPPIILAANNEVCNAKDLPWTKWCIGGI